MIKPRFFHVRNYVNGQLMSRGGETFYVVPYSAKWVKVSHARCNTSDNYSRKIGRTICLNRMSIHKVYTFREEEFFQGLKHNVYRRSQTKMKLYHKS